MRQKKLIEPKIFTQESCKYERYVRGGNQIKVVVVTYSDISQYKDLFKSQNIELINLKIFEVIRMPEETRPNTELKRAREINENIKQMGFGNKRFRRKKDEFYEESLSKEEVKKESQFIQFDPDEIELPRLNRLVSEFATELGSKIGCTNEVLFRVDSRDVVGIGRIVYDNEELNIPGSYLSNRVDLSLLSKIMLFPLK